MELIWRDGNERLVEEEQFEGVGEIGEDLQLVCLLLWLEWPAGSQGIPARVGGWDKALGVRQFGGEGVCDILETGQKSRGEGGCSRLSAAKLQMRQENWI